MANPKTYWTRALVTWIVTLLPLAPTGLVMSTTTASTTEIDVEWGDEVLVGFHQFPAPRSLEALFDGAPIVETNPVLKFVVVQTDSAATLAARLLEDPNTRYAIPNARLEVAFEPNDPLLVDQYGLAHVNAFDAWERTAGNPSKNVCIVDTGIRYTHEDLRDRYLGGADFVNDDEDPWDDHGHGTHVAGIATATSNNGVGVAGVAQVGVLAAKVLSSGGSGSDANIASGIQWCADNGGDVISLSLGSPLPLPSDMLRLLPIFQGMRDAVAYAWNKGSLVVAAAGNSGPCNECVTVPAAFPEVIAVNCTDRQREQCGFSSEGSASELAAPGSDILAPCFSNDGAYCSKSGTSMSTPHASGVAALVWGYAPHLTNEQVRLLLQSTALDLGTPGRDVVFGYGLVDAGAAVQALLADPVVANPACDLVGPRHGLPLTGDFEVRVRGGSVEAPTAWVKLFIDGEPAQPPAALGPEEDGVIFSRTYSTVPYADGIHRLEVRCKAEDGVESSPGRLYTFDGLRVELLEPKGGTLVSGPVTIRAQASAAAGVLRVAFITDGGEPFELAPSPEPGRYEAVWDSTQHVLENDAATLSVQVFDKDGRSESTSTIAFKVDNRPNPSVAIVDPHQGEQVSGTKRVKVAAGSLVGEPLVVELKINGGDWIDITANWDGEHYFFDWNTNGHFVESTLTARATDTAGQSTHQVKVKTPQARVVEYALCWVEFVEHLPGPQVLCKL